MKIHYLVAAYNEGPSLPSLIDKLSVIPDQFPGSMVYVIDNASKDDSRRVLERLSSQNPWLRPCFEDRKGLGVAFRRGLREMKALGLNSTDWVAFNAADLPFGFSDLNSFLRLKNDHPQCQLFVGSKQHSQSVTSRSLKRFLGSWVFQVVRSLLLQMKTRDPQGTLFLRGDQVGIVERLVSDDYFFTTELVFWMEKQTEVIEMPINLNPELRPSKVRLLRDGWKAVLQCWALRTRVKSAKSSMDQAAA